jgi:hypothetical protein
VKGVFWSVKVSEALDVAIVEVLNPFCWLVEASSNGELEVGEVGVFNIPFRGLVIGFLILGKSVTQCTDFSFEVIFKGLVVTFTGLDGCEQSFTDLVKSDHINVFNGDEGGFDSVGGHRLLGV